MKRLLLNIVLFVTTTTCFAQCKKEPYVSPMLKPFVIEYLQTMNNYGINTDKFYNYDSIIVVPDSVIICGDPDNIGCADTLGVVRIKLTDQFWLFNSQYLRVMVYHELGHAVLGLPHINFENHIMFPIIKANIYEYSARWPAYLRSYVTFYFFCEANDYLER